MNYASVTSHGHFKKGHDPGHFEENWRLFPLGKPLFRSRLKYNRHVSFPKSSKYYHAQAWSQFLKYTKIYKIVSHILNFRKNFFRKFLQILHRVNIIHIIYQDFLSKCSKNFHRILRNDICYVIPLNKHKFFWKIRESWKNILCDNSG